MTRRMVKKGALLTGLVLVGVACRPTGLDQGFGTGGAIVSPLSTSTNDRYMAVANGPNGKTYAAGYTTLGTDQAIVVTRFKADGTPDRTFGSRGTATLNVTPGGTNGEVARSVVVQDDGKVVVAGTTENDPTAAGALARDTDIVAVRFDRFGEPDLTFGTGGVAKIDLATGKIFQEAFSSGDSAWGVASLPGKRVAVYGTSLNPGEGRQDPDYVVVGLTKEGQLDPTFGTAGVTRVDLGGSFDNGRNLLFQADDRKLVASGYSLSPSDGVTRPVLIRMDHRGVLDTSFGIDGVATSTPLPSVAESYTVSRQSNGDYVAAGYGRANSTVPVDLIVMRFKANGFLDTTFATNGVRQIDVFPAGDDRARNVVVLPDDRILAVGSARLDAGNVDALSVLLDRNGTVQNHYGEAGKEVTDLGGPADAWFGVALSPDGKYVHLAGYKGAGAGANEDAAIGRIKLDS